MGRPRKNKRKQELHPDINEYYYEADSTEEIDIYGFAPLDSILDPLLEAEKEAKKEARRLKRLEAKRQKQLLEAEQTEIVQHEPVATEEVSEAPIADIDFEIDTGVFDENISGYDYTDDFFMSSEREFRINESEPRSSESIRVDNQQKWNDKKDVMIKCYLESFGLYGEPDPRLSKPLSFNSPCSCQIKFSAQIRCFFMFNNVVANVEYCNCKNLFETLMVMQLLPSSTKSPRLAVHFGLLSFLHKLKMAAGVSNHSFTGVINEFGLQLAGFDDEYSAISKVLLNNSYFIYQNMMLLVNEFFVKTFCLAKAITCFGCEASEHKMVTMDGNFQLKRKSNSSAAQYRIRTAEEEELWGTSLDVKKYEDDDNEEVECSIEDLDSQFKAVKKNERTLNGRYDVNGVFAMSCARHGVPIRLFDIEGGEGRKYALASVESLLKTRPKEVSIMYDIACLCKKKIEKTFPSLASCNTQYAVPIFHAHAHNMHCQMQYNPRYIDHFGLTDGEGIERFWSYTSQFIAMTRSMSKDRRQLLLTDATIYYAEEKMKETPGHIRRKYKECLLSIQKLNMSINEFQRLEFQWKQLSEAMLIKLRGKGLQQFQATAVANSLGNNDKSLYLEAVATFFELKNIDSVQSSMIKKSKKQLKDYMEAFEAKFGVRRPDNLEDPLLAAHIKQARKIKIDAMNNLLDHLVFMILHKEQQMRRPGTLGTDLAARMMQSLASLKKDATLLISSINKQIDLHYEVEEERRKQKVLSLGSLVEDLKKNGLDNRLSLSTEIKDFLMLKRNIEEINFLIDEAKRFIRNLTIEDFKCENAIKSLSVGSISDQGIECMLQKRKLHLQYRLSNAKCLLDDICNASIVKLTVPQTLSEQVSNLQSSGELTPENILSLLVDTEDVDFDQLSIAQFFPPLLPSTGIEEPLVDLIEIIDEGEIVVEDNLLELD